jgi:dihydrofolate reductase
VPGAVAKLKEADGGDILMYGSPSLMRSLMARGLIDEYRLWLVPIVLGRGKRLFTDESAGRLTLTNTRVFDTGLVVLAYQPAGEE